MQRFALVLAAFCLVVISASESDAGGANPVERLYSLGHCSDNTPCYVPNCSSTGDNYCAEGTDACSCAVDGPDCKVTVSSSSRFVGRLLVRRIVNAFELSFTGKAEGGDTTASSFAQFDMTQCLDFGPVDCFDCGSSMCPASLFRDSVFLCQNGVDPASFTDPAILANSLSPPQSGNLTVGEVAPSFILAALGTSNSDSEEMVILNAAQESGGGGVCLTIGKVTGAPASRPRQRTLEATQFFASLGQGTADLGSCACGDGKTDPGEDCDDGNTQDGDNCPANCHRPGGTGPALEQCLADLEDLQAATADSDADGIFDSVDQCPDTATGASIDQVGCSLAQYCGRFNPNSLGGRADCRRSDWKNDEPSTRPRDCKSERDQTSKDLSCIPYF
jgi:cysteine-rich repeat protein